MLPIVFVFAAPPTCALLVPFSQIFTPFPFILMPYLRYVYLNAAVAVGVSVNPYMLLERRLSLLRSGENETLTTPENPGVRYMDAVHPFVVATAEVLVNIVAPIPVKVRAALGS